MLSQSETVNLPLTTDSHCDHCGCGMSFVKRTVHTEGFSSLLLTVCSEETEVMRVTEVHGICEVVSTYVQHPTSS